MNKIIAVVAVGVLLTNGGRVAHAGPNDDGYAAYRSGDYGRLDPAPDMPTLRSVASPFMGWASWLEFSADPPPKFPFCCSLVGPWGPRLGGVLLNKNRPGAA